MKFLKVTVLTMLIISSACSSTTQITSSDPSAKIYIDDMLAGTGTATHSDTKIIGSTTTVKLKKDGCETVNYSFSRNEEFDAGACAGGVFLLFPFLWIQKYRPLHAYEFSCTKTSTR